MCLMAPSKRAFVVVYSSVDTLVVRKQHAAARRQRCSYGTFRTSQTRINQPCTKRKDCNQSGSMFCRP